MLKHVSACPYLLDTAKSERIVYFSMCRCRVTKFIVYGQSTITKNCDRDNIIESQKKFDSFACQLRYRKKEALVNSSQASNNARECSLVRLSPQNPKTYDAAKCCILHDLAFIQLQISHMLDVMFL